MDTSDNWSLAWTALHASLLSSFLSELNERKIRFFILRNYEGLPESNPSKDIDIILAPSQYAAAASCLEECYCRYGFQYVSVRRYGRAHCWYAANLKDKASIHIDLIAGFVHKGFEIFPFDELYEHTHPFKDFRVLDDDYDSVILMYYKLFAAKKLIPRYQERITDGYLKAGKAIEQILLATCGKKLGGELILCLQKKDYASLGAMTGRISRATKRYSLSRQPLQTLCRIGAYVAEQVFVLGFCPRRLQKFIAVLGPDGVGKSTFYDHLLPRLSFYFVGDESRIMLKHHRPLLLPNLGAVGEKAGIMKEDKNFTNPHRGKPAGFLSSFARMTYYWLDYVIGIPRDLRAAVKNDRFLLYDRYIYDFLIDPYRSRIKLPFWIRRAFAAIVPQPRLVFILLTDAETIFRRKPELTEDEIRALTAKYQELAKTHSRFVILDASQTPDALADEAVEVILRTFTNADGIIKC